MKGIRGRLAASFIVVILVSVIILEVMLIYIVKQNYYGSLRGNLSNQIKISADMYSRYYSDTALEDNILYNVDAFWNQSNARVEIIDRRGQIIMDSSGSFPDAKEPRTDIEDALKGKMGEWTGRMEGHGVMAVSYPLKSENQIVGALRFISSTDEIASDIKRTIGIFILIGIFVVFAVGFLSIFLANTILIPLKEVTDAAKSMAAGNFQTRSRKIKDDEIGELSDTLNYMADEIVKREDMKNDFISSVSHELRTPLTSIMGWSITLQNEKFRREETLKDGLEIIAKESERLTHMVEELLDFSKFVSDRIRLKYESVNPSRLLDDIRKQLKLRAVKDGIDFTVEYEEDLPDLMSDGYRLRQVFINILDNAFNFTPPGGNVTLSAAETGKGLLFTVKDTGCGILKEELPRVKEKFYKGEDSKSKNGIGLSICQEIVTLMKGNLDIQSDIGAGTTVTVFLPKEVDNDV
jgi:signal transduction histidine kinase